jgi:hypothetical protein
MGIGDELAKYSGATDYVGNMPSTEASLGNVGMQDILPSLSHNYGGGSSGVDVRSLSGYKSYGAPAPAPVDKSWWDSFSFADEREKNAEGQFLGPKAYEGLQTGLKGFGTAASLLLGLQQLGLGKDTLRTNRQIAGANYGAGAKTTNLAIRDKFIAEGGFSTLAEAEKAGLSEHMAKHGVKEDLFKRTA